MSPRTVTARRPRTPVTDVTKTFHEFLYNWQVAKNHADKRDAAKATLKKLFADGFFKGKATVNETGSQILTFDEPLLIDGHKFLGLENRKTVIPSIDPDAVDALIDSLPADVRAKVQKRVIKVVTDTVIDDEELFKLNQEGMLTDDQLDSVYTETVQWSLNVVKD